VEQRVRVAERSDVEQRLGASLCPCHARDIGEFDGRRYAFSRIEQRGELVQPIVRHA
jgi:hypothetical protein